MQKPIDELTADEVVRVLGRLPELLAVRLNFRLMLVNGGDGIDTTLPEELRWVGSADRITWAEWEGEGSEDVRARRALRALLKRLKLPFDTVTVPDKAALVDIDNLTFDQALAWVKGPLSEATGQPCGLETFYDGDRHKAFVKIGERPSFEVLGAQGKSSDTERLQIVQEVVRWAARSYLLGYDAVHLAIRVACQDYRKDC